MDSPNCRSYLYIVRLIVAGVAIEKRWLVNILTVDLHPPFVLDEAAGQKWSLRSTGHNAPVILDRRGQVHLGNGAVRFTRHLRLPSGHLIENNISE